MKTPLLDIIITHYKEPFETGKKLFDILALQRGISFDDFRVIVVEDGSENVIPDDCLAAYPYRIDHITIPHGGVSSARNAGMDYATAKWISFCDFDDVFSNIYALRDVLSLLPAEQYDMLHCELLTEDFTGEKEILIVTPKKARFVFIHGKYYRRQWLIDNGIRFDETMPFQEDSLFNAIVIAVADYRRIGEIKTVFPPYVWCRRNGSVTKDGRQDEAVLGHFIRNCKLCDFYYENLPKERLEDLVVRVTYDTYFMVKSTRASAILKTQIQEDFCKFLQQYGEYYKKPDQNTLQQIEEISRNELMHQIIPYDFETVTTWKNQIMEGK